MAREIAAYEASDGSLHRTQVAAEQHEETYQFQRWCEGNICVGGEWSARMVSEEILQYWSVKKR